MYRLLGILLIAGSIAASSANGATEHPGWFVRVCPAKTEATRIHLTLSGERQGFSWSWIRGQTPIKPIFPTDFTQSRGSISAAT